MKKMSLQTLQEEYEEKNKLRLDRDISHDEFYLWLAERIGVDENDLPVGLDVLENSKDSSFNDIPLKLWDHRDPFVRSKAARAGMKSWSLSNTVCVLKCVARKSVLDHSKVF